MSLRGARDDGIIMTPALVKITPLPVRKIVGSLSHAEVVLTELGLARFSARTPTQTLLQTICKPRLQRQSGR